MVTKADQKESTMYQLHIFFDPTEFAKRFLGLLGDLQAKIG
jgi:hypothetical protein